MSSEIPKYSLGTNLNEVKNFVLSQKNIDEKVAQSLFNFIEDDIKNGDGLITTSIELAIVNGYLSKLVPKDFLEKIKEIFSEKQDGLPMPPEVDPNEPGVEFNQNSLGATWCKKESFGLTEYTYKTLREGTQHLCSVGDVADNAFDYDNDGIADSRYTNVRHNNEDEYASTSYFDEDFDGVFEKKIDTSRRRAEKGSRKILAIDGTLDETRITYKRDDNGNWVEVERFTIEDKL